ncbi:Hypothetical predicted protein [Olea europaea subsp. europaea]|uniref:Uncharacterized protein n=1 Tax=Olea europaea subsp. europaea TaxID=158383 RepID=A0A8S0VI23_OLEEU|nr:Hypothetical predicted protein [Olea europaea subsp. europaea]
MSRIYDNWERLFGAALDQEKIRELAEFQASALLLQISVPVEKVAVTTSPSQDLKIGSLMLCPFHSKN